jgi:hypothetical protein
MLVLFCITISLIQIILWFLKNRIPNWKLELAWVFSLLLNALAIILEAIKWAHNFL